jgi:hypothetical protein
VGVGATIRTVQNLMRHAEFGFAAPSRGFVADSPPEGRRFEPSVPLATVSLILAEEKGLQADPARAGTAA